MFWLWLLLYGLLFAVPRALMPAAAPLLTPALLAVYWAVLLRGLHTRGRLRSYGLCPRQRPDGARCAAVAAGAAVRRAEHCLRRRAAGDRGGGVSALCRVRRGGAVSRRAAGRLGRKARRGGAAAASAALFALLHLGSAIGGSVSAAAVQALCAFGAGLLLTAVRARTGSIARPLLAHALINLTGSGAVSAAPQAAAYLAASALCTLCALRLLRDAA